MIVWNYITLPVDKLGTLADLRGPGPGAEVTSYEPVLPLVMRWRLPWIGVDLIHYRPEPWKRPDAVAYRAAPGVRFA